MRGTVNTVSFTGELRAIVNRFLSWWGAELWDSLPTALRRLLSGSSARLALMVDPDGLRLVSENGHSSTELLIGEDLPETWASMARVAGQKRHRKKPFGIRLPAEACLLRTLQIPRAAMKDAARILALDLERCTPFKKADVYTAFQPCWDQMPSAKMEVIRQAVIPRTRVDPLLARLRDLGCTVSYIEFRSSEEGAAIPTISLLASPSGMLFPRSLVTKLLAGAIVLLSISAAIIYSQKHIRALAEAETQAQEIRDRAESVRNRIQRSEETIQTLAKLHRMKREGVTTLQVLEELSRILPDTAWLTDLRIDGNEVEISGMASGAANLLPVLERSGFFSQAALTSPLTLVPSENKERFSIRLQVGGKIEQTLSATDRGKS